LAVAPAGTVKPDIVVVTVELATYASPSYTTAVILPVTLRSVMGENEAGASAVSPLGAAAGAAADADPEPEPPEPTAPAVTEK
jgi:hypothetical protein